MRHQRVESSLKTWRFKKNHCTIFTTGILLPAIYLPLGPKIFFLKLPINQFSVSFAKVLILWCSFSNAICHDFLTNGSLISCLFFLPFFCRESCSQSTSTTTTVFSATSFALKWCVLTPSFPIWARTSSHGPGTSLKKLTKPGMRHRLFAGYSVGVLTQSKILKCFFNTTVDRVRCVFIKKFHLKFSETQFCDC